MKKFVQGIMVTGTLLATSTSILAAPVNWTDWTSISGTTATGVLDGTTVTVTGTGALNGLSQTGTTGTNYWTEPNLTDPAYTSGTIDNAPTAREQVGLNTANSITVTFGSAIENLYMALLSVGQPNYSVTYDFDQSFVIDSEGTGYWGNDATNGQVGANDTLTMSEFHGVLLFNAPVSTMTFDTAPGEYWHAFTFGSATSVPEPGSLILLGLGLAGFGFRLRKAKATV